MQLAGVLALGIALNSCELRPQQRCELAPSAIVARSPELSFDAVVVTASGAREAPLFVWSDASGLWVRRAVAGAPVRVGARCRGGLDAQPDGAGFVVACSRSAERGSEVVVYRLESDLRARSLGAVGSAGRDGHGVALALSAGSIYVAFHDGSVGEHAIWLARLRGGERTERRLSPAGVAAGEPTLVAHAGQVYAAFSQLELGLGRELESSIWIARALDPPLRVARARVPAPAPKLTADARGLVLGFRDRARLARGDPSKNELYVARVGPAGTLANAPRAVGRANSEGDPSVAGCGPLTVALLPRDYGGERFVGINALDSELASLGPGHQFYASARDFVLASAACVEHGWLLVTASRAAPGRPGVEAAALRFSCAE